MAGLCEGGNEPLGSLKAISQEPYLLLIGYSSYCWFFRRLSCYSISNELVVPVIFNLYAAVPDALHFQNLGHLTKRHNIATNKLLPLLNDTYLSNPRGLKPRLECLVLRTNIKRREIRTHDQRPAREQIAREPTRASRSTEGRRAAERREGKGPTRRGSLRAHLLLAEKRRIWIVLWSANSGHAWNFPGYVAVVIKEETRANFSSFQFIQLFSE
ncbi:hypothetical protein ANN_25746 [Periplaneta americana]|uniref:Uncharacterized protein n=1 Tax=Periplaneta americana TaxID=6978 RepID=A0ABQ8S482_PERAM|nr:hypothetical protein ANN_25746 [Periplaneta americana]